MKVDDSVQEKARCVLREAASYIREHGWCQGSYERENGSACLVGSIQKVTGAIRFISGITWAETDTDEYRERASVFSAAILRLATQVGHNSVPHYNDYVLPRGDAGKELAIQALLDAANMSDDDVPSTGAIEI